MRTLHQFLIPYGTFFVQRLFGMLDRNQMQFHNHLISLDTFNKIHLYGNFISISPNRNGLFFFSFFYWTNWAIWARN